MSDDTTAEVITVQPRKTRILVADESRLFRTSLLGILRENFEIREAADGEAALQAVLLDGSIRILIADIDLPKIDGLELLSRIRSSTAPRIRDLPVVVMVPAEREAESRRAKALGATDVVQKSAKAAELIARLDILVQLSNSGELVTPTQDSKNASPASDPETDLQSLAYFERQVEKLISFSRRNLANVTIICIQISFAGPNAKAGDSEIERWLTQIGRTLAATIRLEDLGTRSDRAEFCLAAQVTGMVDGLRFATRVRRVVEGMELAPGVEVRTCLGVVSLTEDMRRNAPELRTIAQRRAQQARASRSRRIVLGATEMPLQADRKSRSNEPVMDVGLALALIRAGRASEVLPQLPNLLVQIDPLLKLSRQQEELRSIQSMEKGEQ